MPSITIEEFFKHIVHIYNCGDVDCLIQENLGVAGPLLACTVNGIDLMMAGFTNNSQVRSIQFMTTYMNLGDDEAKLVYTLVRCGLSHEGVTKLGACFFVHDARIHPGRFIYKSEDNCIWLNVTELARSYLDDVKVISRVINLHLSHLPPIATHHKASQLKRLRR